MPPDVATPPPVPARMLYPLDEVASLLGNVSRSCLYDLFERGELRSVLVGRRRLVPAQALADYIARLEAKGAA